jgi:hypothetical protein
MIDLAILVKATVFMLGVAVAVGPVAMSIMLMASERGLVATLPGALLATMGDTLTALLIALFPRLARLDMGNVTAIGEIVIGVILVAFGLSRLISVARSKEHVHSNVQGKSFLAVCLTGTFLNPVMIAGHSAVLLTAGELSIAGAFAYAGFISFLSFLIQLSYIFIGSGSSRMVKAFAQAWIGIALFATVVIILGLISIQRGLELVQ